MFCRLIRVKIEIFSACWNILKVKLTGISHERKTIFKIKHRELFVKMLKNKAYVNIPLKDISVKLDVKWERQKRSSLKGVYVTLSAKRYLVAEETVSS